MSKEVGYRWRELTDAQRAEYEEKARIETLKEQKRLVEERQAQAAQALAEAQNQAIANFQNSTSNYSSPIVPNQMISFQQNNVTQKTADGQQIYIISNGAIQQHQPNQQLQQMQTTQQYIMFQPVAQNIPQKTLAPQQVQHKEAYIKYIANMRKQQQLALQSMVSHTNTVSLTATASLNNDWHRSLDVGANIIKENKVMPPPMSWIENCGTDDVLKHLASLRYYMLNDALNVKKIDEYSLDTMNDESKENESGAPTYCQL